MTPVTTCEDTATYKPHSAVIWKYDGRNFFSQRVVSPWNQLPAHIIEAPSFNAFKNRYNKMKSGA